MQEAREQWMEGKRGGGLPTPPRPSSPADGPNNPPRPLGGSGLRARTYGVTLQLLELGKEGREGL